MRSKYEKQIWTHEAPYTETRTQSTAGFPTRFYEGSEKKPVKNEKCGFLFLLRSNVIRLQ